MVCSQSTHFTWTRIRIVWMAWVCWAWRKLFRMYELPCYRMRIELMLNIHTLLMLWYTLSLHSMLLLLLVPAFLFSTWDLHSVHDQVFNCYCKQIAFHLVVDFISPSTFFDSIKDPHPQLWLVSWMLENGAKVSVYDRMNEDERENLKLIHFLIIIEIDLVNGSSIKVSYSVTQWTQYSIVFLCSPPNSLMRVIEARRKRILEDEESCKNTMTMTIILFGEKKKRWKFN